ncbi:MAG: hypothetical protein A3C79_00435 [Candidatus Taylorbacteria bacterium RIFCSPHIGHO2_02_FULL_45_28]|uniref:Uncharacterized protein n=1 Tax=Candidatus Taylorbacteria bacterium RIFCSPHIGHO2_12_FULL_45_16 TaxID=1802315 RepID=A0A1G2MZ44_9BACT|nr:MAG: hypothetical protein A2830_01690 [Candidatus Taylorbacteria bacterium RIFCSPHIGHO2_01_FULL_44_110]OHA25489.1 MAG: hypothetical protein A3C79_00435 [Candidatus Taylorbacteria bacterium RIFCSPHIGHO2_02_FULL_45_28]OHA29156.1 MAG: hypothetical protein A3F51_00900 [Candidatus Taylorbacteria bacterium RIFCSPHIGHO2_12_FULL_45_16]OHA33378.1 MAG: hypothetical protein A3A23_01780 [Candidatus Taylorbacteria bacterium RIFCSPLOWO2_01_FULL_45_59]OHA39889.1 MAG: hypothetical protein A3I98_01820 [Candi
MATTTKFVGDDYEAAYAKVLGGTVNGGLGDGGRDVIVPEIGGVQVKASSAGAKEFLAVSLKRKQFIPLCVGEPSTKEEVLDSLKKFGAWVGKEIPNRAKLLAGISQIRLTLM